MRSGNIELKSDLVNLFKDLEEAKRDSRNVVPISKPKIDQSDIKDLFSSLEEASKEARVVKKKRRNYVETTPADLSNLLQGLEEASVEAKKSNSNNEEKLSEFSNLLEKITVVEETKKPEEKETDYIKPSEDNPVDDITSDVSAWIDKSKEENDKLDALEELLTVSVDKIAKDIEEEEVELLSKLGDNQEPVKEEVNLISGATSHLDNKKKKKKLTVKEEINDITTLRKEFDNFRSLIAQQIASSQMSGAGGGEVRLEFLDDVQRTTAKVDGKFLKYSSSAGKFIGADGGGAAADLSGNTLSSGITASSLTSVGTLTSLTVDNIFINGTTIGHTDDTDLIALADGIVTVAGELSVTTLDIGGTNVTATAAELNILDGVTSTASELNLVDGITAGTISASKAVIVDSNKDLTGLRNLTIAGNLTVSGTTTTVNKTVVNVEEAFIFEGATADAHETTFRIDEPTADRTASLQDKTGTIALLSGFRLNATDGSASNDGDFLVLNTSADENDRLLFEDGTSDPLSVLASHGITLSGQGWNAFQFDNT